MGRSPDGYQATVTVPNGVSMSSTEIYLTTTEAMTAAAMKPLDIPKRPEALDRSEAATVS